MRAVQFGDVEVTRMVVGGNPFSGFSHQNQQRDREMVRYYTVARIKEALRKAEVAGINTFFGRTDRHVRRMLLEYWDEGGQIQWFGQTASELGDQLRAIRDAAAAGAKGVYVHGGIVDYWYAQGKYDMLEAALEQMRECGLVAGFAGHMPEVHAWIRDNLRPDFQMCSYYNPSPRGDAPHHVSGLIERWDDADREAMTALIQTIPWPVVHYKVFAGGNRPIRAGFEFLAGQMRDDDLTCIGHYLGDNPDMIAENVRTFEELVEARVPA
jgi:AcrR family transcriptional regulator